ncbi:MAG: CPBP family intramembrane metalloprotease [Candidatus Doudnabacteria bacterium]|nr:CPBP family intramembrane metalloprotease [Candidatus Doudnabacteria bacterium]
MKVLLEIIFIFILPVLLALFNIVRMKYRFHVFAVMILAGIMIVFSEHWSLLKLGMYVKQLSNGVVYYTAFTILAAAFIVFISKFLKQQPVAKWWLHSHFLWGFIAISVTQEFLYRSFLMPELQTVFRSALIVIILNTLIFTFIHLIYPNRLINLTMAFLGGLGIASLYFYFPNFYLVSLCHTILNFAVVYYRFFTFPDTFVFQKN